MESTKTPLGAFVKTDGCGCLVILFCLSIIVAIAMVIRAIG